MLLFYSLACHKPFDFSRLTKTLRQIGLSVAMVLHITACSQQKPEPPQPRPVQTIIAKVNTETAQAQYVGEVVAHTDTLLAFRLAGRVLQVHADISDQVKAGQVLATLDDADSKNQLESLRENWADAQTATQLSKSNLQRMQALANTGAISAADLDQAQANYHSAQARQQSLLANVKNAQQNLGYNQLLAPVSGVILNRSVNVGQVIEAGQQAFEIASNDTRDAVMQVAESQRLSLQHLKNMRVQLISDPNISAKATLRDISPQANPDTRTWRVRLSLIDVPAQMALGSAVSVTTDDFSAPQTIKIPASALTRDGAKAAVFVVNANQTLMLRAIQIDHYSADDIYIRQGLKSGDRVVTAGVNKLISGEKVALQEADQ
ncbi:efflux RND transporter periplasmic adaptor subunit [Acinetobacter sp. MD2]|uniref:efflux RND transporter periplasmic adaptor subunit n=1 Tax=Acinetobacter sp. MD2 TaxID=2600066 RepID=UPI002D1F2364|nr:efflux RND transporter periplasmic adaptor subunit [Acinetobacter sp. MD2]MEB3767863.1 efflux RND transporter periplasmic adaptor subunit [Acinetobacter sp. MD2]